MDSPTGDTSSAPRLQGRTHVRWHHPASPSEAHRRWVAFGPMVAILLLSASVISLALVGWYAVVPAVFGLVGTVLVMLPRFVATGPVHDVYIDDQVFALHTDGSPQNSGSTAHRSLETDALGPCFRAFLEAPGPLTWSAANDAMFAHPAYAPRSLALDHAEDALEAGDLDAAAQLLSSDMPNLLMSPNAHLLAGALADQRGDATTAELEFTLAGICVEGILSTGDGTHERPFVVQRVSDEYDVLRRLNARPTHQALVHEGARSLDVMDLEDGTQLHFDVTRFFTHPSEPA